MNGELANVIALALHGSVWLSDPIGDAPGLERLSSTFQYVGRTRFDPPEDRQGRTEPHPGCGAWLAWLRDTGVTRLWLTIPTPAREPLEPHVAAAFSNGGRWGLLADGVRSSVWVPGWDVGDPHASDSRIWSVRFVGSWIDGSAAPSRPPVAAAQADLTAALIDARQFARDQDLTSWADWFDDAIGRAEADRPEIPYHPDLAPQPPVSTAAARTLASAAKSWVFGGMGSWNDVWVSDPAANERLQEVSRTLYRTMLTAFVAATNDDFDQQAAS